METVNSLDIQQIAQTVFNLKALKPYQLCIIEDVLQQKDLLIVSPTGSGKSLCYQIPALKLSGTLIVVSPLIALMVDQVKKLQSYGVAAECIHSNLERIHQEKILQLLQTNQLKILYVSPERLLRQFFLKLLKKITISAIAIDEAHCIVHWGNDFRPEYERLALLKKYFPDTPILALTATATPKQQVAIMQKLGLVGNKHIFSAFKPNINFKIIPQYLDKTSLSKILKQHHEETGIIYCASQKRVNYLYHHLKLQFKNVLYFHAGLDNQEKINQQKLFYQLPYCIMIATMAFGMGIDKKNIRYVIHYDVPGRLDQFIQECGRAGRDEQPATSYLFYHPEHFFQFNFWRITKAPVILKPELINDLYIMSNFLLRNECFQKLIFNYFEQIQVEKCNTCEACCFTPEFLVQDTDKLKLLSCIYRVHQQAEWDLIPYLMIGKPNNKTKDFETISTFGIGCKQTKDYWFHQLNLLFSLGLINLNIDTTIKWALTLKGKQFLKTSSR